jgi:hypothetical protein
MTLTSDQKAVNHGNNLRYLVDHSDLPSIQRLAQALSLSPTTIYSMYKRDRFEHDQIQKICSVFNVTAEEFSTTLLKGLTYKFTPPTDPIGTAKILELTNEIKNLQAELLEANKKIIKLLEKESQV